MRGREEIEIEDSYLKQYQIEFDFIRIYTDKGCEIYQMKKIIHKNYKPKTCRQTNILNFISNLKTLSIIIIHTVF
jgi:hypothetical protein